MTAFRVNNGGDIDRKQPIRFLFDGRAVEGLEGDTVASALLASGVSIVGRSFKYHRPRGIWGAGVEEPNALIDIASDLRAAPNCRATTERAESGLVVTSVNSKPNAANDRNAFIDRFSRFIPAAFYYKTFMFPDWHLFEPRIREMAGLGKVDPKTMAPETADAINEHCDVLVVGAGPAGLSAALTAARAGKRVIICDEKDRVGGSLLHRSGEIDGKAGRTWVNEVLAELREAGAIVLTDTTAFGAYDHLLVALHQKLSSGVSRLWRIRPDKLILATGAIERPLPFANNDLPGIHSADAALVYLRRYGVALGRKVIIATNNGTAYQTASALLQAGCDVTVVDYRTQPGPTLPGCKVLRGRTVAKAVGKAEVSGVVLDDGTKLDADCVLVSGGMTPTIHLFCQAKGKLSWRDDLLAFVPGQPIENVSVVGAADGKFALSDVLASGSKALGSSTSSPSATGMDDLLGIMAAWPKPKAKGRVWIDLQNDVTAKDVELAARENYVSVEHLKRYTTLGMATDQGKTSNLNGLALMAEITGRRIPEVGTTTYRPPFTPVPFPALAGPRSGELFNPVRRLPLEDDHRADGAFFQEYGGWLRPAWYGSGDPQATIEAEVRKARASAALFDGSTLGKIEVLGPDAAAFLDFIYYNTVSTLKPGKCRYGFILAESGVIYDDGVLVRLDDNRFVVSCSSSHVAGMYALLEEWRQDRFDKGRVFIHNATADMATLTVSGPKARQILDAAELGINTDDATLPHMSMTNGVFDSCAIRVSRISFTGDRSYEISIPADYAPALWKKLKAIGRDFDATLLGVEALMIMRAEKGYIVIGKDTDGMSRPMDFGATAPLEKKKPEFIGKRSLHMFEAQRPDRKQFVGLEVLDGGPMLPTGAHAVEKNGAKIRSLGYVTSSYFSPTLGRPIALGLVERGTSRQGETVTIQHLGATRQAKIVSPCAYDPDGGRLNA